MGAIVLFFVLFTLGCVNYQNGAPSLCYSIDYEKIELNEDWGLETFFNYTKYGGKGIFYNEQEFDEIFSHTVNGYKESGGSGKRAENEPIKPTIDFGKYSVIWYSDRYSYASQSELTGVTECENVIFANMKVIYSDYGSSRLRLWKIPKTNKSITFIEEKRCDAMNQEPCQKA